MPLPTAQAAGVPRQLASLFGTLLGAGRPRQRPGGSASPAARLQRSLRPVTFSLEDFRSEVVRAVELEQEIEQLTRHQRLTGRWRKDRSASDPMGEACDLVALPWVLRQGIKVLDVMELKDSEEFFETNLKAGGVLDVRERYPWTGEPVRHSRRDKRKGHHEGYVARTEQGPSIICTWEDPYGGECTDTFVLSECGGVLTQFTSMSIRSSGRSTQYKTVYRRVHQ